MRFYDDIMYDREYNGLVLDDDEGQLPSAVGMYAVIALGVPPAV